jgi:hypothetical protein
MGLYLVTILTKFLSYPLYHSLTTWALKVNLLTTEF